MRIVLLSLFSLLSILSQAQESKKVMDHEAFDLWNRIAQPTISDNGQKVVYQINPGKGDPSIALYDIPTKVTTYFERASGATISSDGKYLCFKTSVSKDTMDHLKRSKTKKKDLPKDTLSIYNTVTEEWTKVEDLKSFSHPEKWSDYLIYHIEPQKPVEKDTLLREKIKKESSKNGSKCIVHHLPSGIRDTMGYVTKYITSEEGNLVAALGTGIDSTDNGGVYIYNTQNPKWQSILKGKAKINQTTFNKKGSRLAFTIDTDTTKVVDRPHQLFVWEKNAPAALRIAGPSDEFVPDNWNISADYKPRFSEDGKYLYFGIKPPAITQDTSLLDEEIVNVEVWSYTDDKLHTQQKVQVAKDQKKSYLSVYDFQKKSLTQLSDQDIDYVSLPRYADGQYVLGVADQQYQKYISWQGYAYKDLYLIEVNNGRKKKIAEKIVGRPRFSNAGKYIYWYSGPDTSWMAYHIETQKRLSLTNNELGTFYNELNDRPMHPWSYGNYGWSEDDQYFMVNDRFDIWKVNPLDKTTTKRITHGREKQIRHRYISFDREQKFIDLTKPLMLSTFDEKDKSSGFAEMSSSEITQLLSGDYYYNPRPTKAKSANAILYTRENFQTYPDLIVTEDGFKTSTKVSDVNPQQSSYRWGTSKIHKWNSLKGKALEGMLITPDDFDPNKKYPLLVNFYERSSHNLHRHTAPYPHRSTINYSFYVNRGYVIFNPDVFYENGYPGQGAYDCVIPGIESLIEKGFIDEKKIGVQGHSWGGYQVAHLVTKTDLFACAESGAPVVNMISAYGGIRWASGLSRMFQYEHTQSRLGATLWDNPDVYIENSPIFNIDKINTPVLIMHNDADGHVPWYQGIEFFVALRRLGKPTWMLNYNDEPHWPLKRQNRLDFNKRMQQFFDHYLMDGPKPSWMENGVSAINKGINQGY